MDKNKIIEVLDEIIPDPKCSLLYKKDYELLIAVMLSAQCTDERVNQVTPNLFTKYDIFSLVEASQEDICNIIRPCGNMNKKSGYIKEIARRLVNEYGGIVPNNREFLESLPGVGRKTTNVLLSNLFAEQAFAVDTHVERVAKRLGLACQNDDVLEVEKKLCVFFQDESYLKLHHQLLLFGRHYCTSRNPKCENCPFKEICKF
ncbi:MAG: endonuclease III [Bacilli bacterium]|nr:endonuclease III [Bacilli bacterium]